MIRERLILFLLLIPQISVFAQNYLTDEQEQSIKLSNKYYWEEGSDFDEVVAYENALNNLTERIISDVVYQTKKRDEVLKELEMKAHTGRIPQEGMVSVVAWIAKDSVFVTSQRPLNPPQTTVVPQPVGKHVEPLVVAKPQPVLNNKEVSDIVLQELIKCKNYKEVNKIANKHGMVKGNINSSNGFDRPELCYIAIFDTSWSLVALFDKGGTSRKDLLSGQTMQNLESYYRSKGCCFLYLLRK